MTTDPYAPPPGTRADFDRADAIAVVSAYGAFRLVLILLAVWTFFAGFALLFQGAGVISLGGGGGERAAGAQMIVLAPVYGLLAWRRDQYRLFLWVPYAAQAGTLIAIILERDGDAALFFIITAIFLALLIYVWWSSHPLGFFAPAEEPDLDEDDDATGPGAPASDGTTRDDDPARSDRQRRYRRQ